MKENFPTPNPLENGQDKNQDKELQKKEYMIALTTELAASLEAFPFPGIDPEIYNKMKIDEEPYLDSGYFTSIDEVIKKIQEEGMKIMLGKDGDAYALPFKSTDLQGEGVRLKNLQIDQSMDRRIHQLILLQRWDGTDGISMHPVV